MTDGENTQTHVQGNSRVDCNGRVDEGVLTEPHCFHLLGADAGIPECYEVFQTWVALCGRRLSAGELPSSMCSPDCQREITYCPECVRVAVECNADADAAHIVVAQLEQLRELVGRDG